MKVRNVYVLFTLLGFREISKKDYYKRLRKGYEESTIENELLEDSNVTWSIRICYPRIFCESDVLNKFEKNYTMYTGIV